MPDYIGRIAVPEITPAEVFPLVPDFGSGRSQKPDVAVHRFKTGNVKIEQRFLLGNGAKRFHIRSSMTAASRASLRTFWDTVQGSYGAFTYNAPDDDGAGATAYVCRFEDNSLTYEYLTQTITGVGVTLVEIPQTSPDYTLNSTEARFPGGSLTAALLTQVQILIPLLKITVKEVAVDVIYVSDRRCIVGGQLYQARLISWDGISQSMNGPSDYARFVFANADRVMSDLVNDTEVLRATIEFSLFHVGTGIKLDLWKGHVTDWEFTADSTELSLSAADGLHELNLPYPVRRITRTCWKEFDDGAACPYAAQGSTGGDPTTCDKGFATANGCQAHGMDSYFGGIQVTPQAVRTKDNSTGHWGYGRSPLTSVSLVADSVYSEVVPEYYVLNWSYPLKVNAKLVAGRDEGDFYIALGLVGEGPLGAYAYGHTLDGQANHGPGSYGLRQSLGADPNPDPFSLGSGGSGEPQVYGSERAAGTAFIELRRTDPKGLQLSKLSERAMEVLIAQGMAGWKWTGTGARSSVTLANPIWICVNMLLRALGLQNANAATQELYFDVDSAVAAGAICDTVVASLVDRRPIEVTPPAIPLPEPEDGGYEEQPMPDDLPAPQTEKQFQFCGGLIEEKPLRDWMTEALNNCLGFFIMRSGKLAFGIRSHSGATEPFTEGNIALGTLRVQAHKAQFNDLTVNFADEEYKYVNSAVRFYDIDHAKRIGGVAPRYEKGQMNLVGTSTKSQAVRIAQVRLKEEVGGINETEQRTCRDVSFQTTVLALASEPGKVGSITHADMPGGYGEFRMIDWRLRRDYGIEISGRGTFDSMYDLVTGPKPADVPADPLPQEDIVPASWNFDVATDRDGILFLKNFTCKTNSAAVDRGVFEIYFAPEDEIWVTILDDTMLADESDTTMGFAYEPLRDGEWAWVEDELMYISSIAVSSPNFTAQVLRGSDVFGDAANVAAAHGGTTIAIQSIDPDSNAVITLPAGLSLRPGYILYTLPAGEWQFVSSYDPVTGLTELALPYVDISVGMDVFFHPRLYRVTMKRMPVLFGSAFLRAQDRARFQVEIPMPYARIAAVRGYLETRSGKRSNILLKLYTNSNIRTLGTTQYLLTYPDLPVGSMTNAFNTLRADTTQSFERIFAKKRGGAVGPPLEAPRTVASTTPAVFQYGGSIAISGSPLPGDQILIAIGDPATESVFLRIPPYTCNTTDGTSYAQIATALRNWLNGTEEFFAFYYAEANNDECRIVDKAGVNGLITAQGVGTISLTAVGMVSILGVESGRRYALSVQDTLDGWESELGPLSYSTGPTGGATQVVLSDLPRTAPQAGVDRLRVWAAPDGADTPLRLVADVAIGTDQVSDTLNEATLALQTPYPGPSQPAAPGAIILDVHKDGGDWCQLRIAADKAQSNVIDGRALNNIAQGLEITVDIDNQSEQSDVDVVIE